MTIEFEHFLWLFTKHFILLFLDSSSTSTGVITHVHAVTLNSNRYRTPNWHEKGRTGYGKVQLHLAVHRTIIHLQVQLQQECLGPYRQRLTLQEPLLVLQGWKKSDVTTPIDRVQRQTDVHQVWIKSRWAPLILLLDPDLIRARPHLQIYSK